MIIREATLNDIDKLMVLAKAMYTEGSFKVFNFNETKARTLMLRYINKELKGYFIVAEKDGELYGAMLSYIGEHYFGNSKTVNEMAWFVDPSKRGGTAGARLVKATEKWAKEQGASQFFIGLSYGDTKDSSISKAGELLKLLGMEYMGGNYRKLL